MENSKNFYWGNLVTGHSTLRTTKERLISVSSAGKTSSSQIKEQPTVYIRLIRNKQEIKNPKVKFFGFW